MERPIDAPIFENARLQFLVLDEVHAYRGVQATEIAFLIRRLKDRLGVENLVSIATSATLGKPGDPESEAKVCQFGSDLFGEDFLEPNPIYGTAAQPDLKQPSFCPTVTQYIDAADFLRGGDEETARQSLYPNSAAQALENLLESDENLYRLRKEILTRPVLLSEAAEQLWPNDPLAQDGLQALLEIVATASKGKTHDDLLPTRLHYFVRAQDGLHVCLHRDCPGRHDGKPAYFVSRKSDDNTPEGRCSACFQAERRSQLVEVVTCRKCGYFYGALQDLGPRRARDPETTPDAPKPQFDSFSAELGWAADSFWSYFSVEEDLPYPDQPKAEEENEDEDQDNLFLKPAELEWCVTCGKKNDQGAGDNCRCESPHLRKIKVFHRQCHHSGRPRDIDNLYNQRKKPLTSCPNCGVRNGSGLEPVRRFQESDDETGLAMAIPLSHFQVSHSQTDVKPRKLLCFTDHRQRAAAFPALLEEETFPHDLGRMIVRVLCDQERLDFVELGEALAERADPQSPRHAPDFFLPSSRFPDEDLDAKGKRNLWIAETFSYFGIPDSARESAEDLGLVAIEYDLKDVDKKCFHELLPAGDLSLSEATAALQVLLGFIRQRKAFTLPNQVQPDATAFGRVTADIAYALRREGHSSIVGWLPRRNNDGSYRDNFITDYLRRLLSLPPDETYRLGEDIWSFMTSQFLLIERRNKWKLDHERLFVMKAPTRYVCDRCGVITAYSVRQCCPRKACAGKLQARSFTPSQESIIARWVADAGEPKFTTLKSEEHTAQINKDLAKKIEDGFREDGSRIQGVNLLSSTTTFEMGINIGDLQKVLLRNAPPSSASYVQRVGRAGRGGDKNSVCVTLCRRTKYDADAWSDPPNRLMSGEVRTPTVFANNRIIAQRHFNAVVFARFLRIKIADERMMGNMKQQIPLAALLSPDSRTKIPAGWSQHPATLYLDFPRWLETQEEGAVFQTQAGRSLLQATGGFDIGREEVREIYKKILGDIENELSALMTERQRLFNQGRNVVDIERAVKNLLRSDVISILAKRGFLPRYAFPLDTVTLETGWSRWSRDTDVELSRDRGIAIAEFAPGAQVIAHKKVFTSSGLYVVSSTDKPERLWYAKCSDCQQIRTARLQNQLTGACGVCQRNITTQHVKAFVEPAAFSVRIERGRGGAERQRRASLIRQRQTLTHFIDSVRESNFQDFGLFSIALKEDGALFRYNLGPENKGFVLCPSCGYSEPKRSFKAGRKHKKLRGSSENENCERNPWSNSLAYGHEFKSFCLIARPSGHPPVESLAYALQKGLCRLLDIEDSEIGVSWRWLANPQTTDGSRAEIILYDRTPGGAGFAKEGFNNWSQVVERAHNLCNDCQCEEACYDCLKDYGNQSHHEKLDRCSVKEYLAAPLLPFHDVIRESGS